MPLINKQPFTPSPIPSNVGPDDEVFYHELTNEIFTSHDAFFDRFLFCNSLIWTCGRTGKSGLTYQEALESEQAEPTVKKKRGKRERAETEGDGTEPVKKKKKKYPYDPKKYAMPVPEGFDPSLLTPTGKIDGRKLKSKKNKQLAEELLSTTQSSLPQSSESSTTGKKGKHKKKVDDATRKEDEARRKEEEAKKKAQLQAELAKEREAEAKRKKEAAALAKQLERQKREEERKKAAAFLQNWEKKCEDLERDDLRRLPQPTSLNCDLPDRLFGDALFIMEALYNLHEVFNFSSIYPEGLNFDTLEEILFEKQEDGPLGTLIQFLLKTIIDTQPTGDGYGLDDDPSKLDPQAQVKTESTKPTKDEITETNDTDHEHETNGLGSEADEDDENEDKEVKMNDLIGSAIKAAQEVKLSLSKPLAEMELNSSTVTEILRLHLLQSGSFPKGRTIYNGWYSSREDPGLWLCMQEPDLIKKLGEVSIYELDMEERIKILHTLIYQLFSFIRTRLYIESASEQLTELRKQYRKEAADFARWDRENCVKRMQPPKRKGEQDSNHNSDKSNGHTDHDSIKLEHAASNPSSINGDVNDADGDHATSIKIEKDSNQHLKSCLKSNGNEAPISENDDMPQSKKKITFKTSTNGAIDENGLEGAEQQNHDEPNQNDDTEHSYEELERAYQQNLVDYEDYQRERAIRHEELNKKLIELRSSLRMNQCVYGIHPIGRDRAYRRYWLFQSLPGLFVEQDEEYVGKCLANPTPLESRYKKLFNKDNPLMHPNEADLIRTKTCEVACSTDPIEQQPAPSDNPDEKNKISIEGDESPENPENGCDKNDLDDNHNNSDRLNGEQNDDQDDLQEMDSIVHADEYNICTGDEASCAVHGQKRPTQTKWWFYHTPDSINQLIESLNKRGYRESELHDVLTAEISIIKPRVAECPAYKLNKYILEQSGIRRSRRLRTKGSKKRGRKYERD